MTNIRFAKGLIGLIGLVFGASVYADEDLRMYLEGLRAGAPAVLAGQTLQSADAVMAFYLENNHQPVWVQGGALEAERKTLPNAIELSQAHGFIASRYHYGFLTDPLDEERAEYVTEILATDAFLTQARHRAGGVVSPASLDPDWHLVDTEHDVVEDLKLLSSQGGSVAAYLEGLWPQNEDYRLLIEERSRIAAQADTRSEVVPSGPLLKMGSTGPRVLALKRRLLGPDEYTDMFDEALDREVRIFQISANLEPDGLVGPSTLGTLNATQIDWINRIDANLERWRWLPQQIPEDYISVNIAAFELKAVHQGMEEFTMRVIVGRNFRETPVFVEDMRYFVLNPYWNVPFKLATEDKLPKLKTNPAELSQAGYQVRRSGEESFIDVTSVDWSSVSKRNFNFLLRQQPGPSNALGRIKFMMPNEFSIYLHDTNDHTLFAKTERGFSSGCIRLSDPEQLASWLLHREGRVEDASKLSSQLADGQTRTINLRKPLPVYIVYFTAFKTASSDISFRRDIYQRDEKIVNALRQE
ncbi:MAG: L,D-transpeptidase family protein [Pseudomonadales bacterium]|jgi:murein L,D-transpeptidase YcbB/YkuD|nr:L,D-transpeptidase family protein [Pseudomonadales bacterium]